MKILITGAKGFIAKNLIEHLKRDDTYRLYLYEKEDGDNILEAYVKEVDFIFHLAGVNRPKKVEEFYEGNSMLTQKIIEILIQNSLITPIVLSSSTQVLQNNDYGKSKLEAENSVLNYAKKYGAAAYIYRLPNVFGKWSRPNYNSVIATWCYSIARNIEIQINNRETLLDLVYIDDVIDSFLLSLAGKNSNTMMEVTPLYQRTLGEIESLLYCFKDNRETLIIPPVASGFERALYATYLTYLEIDNFSYALKGHEDNRGAFYEILKTVDSGQFSVSTTAPGVKRGSHFHHTKNEKFLVVKGEALIEFRHIVTNERVSYKVSDKKMEVVEMIPGYTHNIKNIGKEEMILFLWANENYDDEHPDTYFLEV